MVSPILSKGGGFGVVEPYRNRRKATENQPQIGDQGLASASSSTSPVGRSVVVAAGR